MTFKKGQSGNPKGKPPGITARGRFRAMVNDALPSIVEKLIESAQEGDVQAANIILSKVIPNLKPTGDNVAVPMSEGATLADRGMAVLAAASRGDLNPDDAKGIMDLLVAQARLVEQSEVLQRLERVERWLHSKGKL